MFTSSVQSAPPALRPFAGVPSAMVRAEVGGLSTHVWLPVDRPRAVLVVRTPDGARSFHDEGVAWAGHGVALVVQDVRGRYGSSGLFRPYVDEGADGIVLLQWVRDQTWCDGPVVLHGAAYAAHCAVEAATAAGASDAGGPDGVVVAVPALGLGEATRTRGGAFQLGSRVGWWGEHGPDPQSSWRRVLEVERRDAARAAAVSSLSTPLLAIGGTADQFAHDTVDLAEAWGGPARLVMGTWDHRMQGADSAARILAWLDAVLAHAPPRGVEAVTRTGASVLLDRWPTDARVAHLAGGRVDDVALERHVPALRRTAPLVGHATVTVHADEGDARWCARLGVHRDDGEVHEIAHGASHGPRIPLGPVVLDAVEADWLTVTISTHGGSRYAIRGSAPHVVGSIHLELTV